MSEHNLHTKKSKWNCHFDGDSIASNIFFVRILFGQNDNGQRHDFNYSFLINVGLFDQHPFGIL